jgi:polar amino acid transport system substrate-binding protein
MIKGDLLALHQSRLLASLVGGVVIAALLAGCSSGSGSVSASSPKATAASKAVASVRKQFPADVLDRGYLSVGTRQDSPPNDFKDTNGEEVGWEIDMMNAIAQTAGLSVKWNYSSFDALIPALQAKRDDFAFGAMGTKKARQSIIDFVSWAQSGGTFVKLASNAKPIKTLDQLCGMQVAVVGGTGDADLAATQSSQCESSGKKAIDILTFGTADEAILAVRSGRAQMFYGETTNTTYLAEQSNGKVVVVGHDVSPTPLGIGFPKGSTQMEKAVMAAIQQLIDNGTYGRILKKWGLSAIALKAPELNPTPSA